VSTHPIPIEPDLRRLVPATFALLEDAGLAVHPLVRSVLLTGSRGYQGRFRQDSDIDLTLVVTGRYDPAVPASCAPLRAVIDATRRSWRSPVELDLAVAFDTRGCGFSCFAQSPGSSPCGRGGIDCFGVFKIGKGFDGIVSGLRIEVARMAPWLRVWARTRSGARPVDRAGACS